MENTKSLKKSGSTRVNSKVNKHIQVWLCSFLLGEFGVDRFTRKQPLLGILKLAVSCLIPCILTNVILCNFDFSVINMGVDQITAQFEAILDVNLPIVIILAIDSIISGVWILIDFIIALVKAYGQAYGDERMFTFDKQGKYMR